MKFTTREKELLNIAFKKGYLELVDFWVYKDPKYQRITMQRFIDLGLISRDVGDTFKVNLKLIKDILFQNLNIFEIDRIL
jgi:hypothetical protein